MNDTKKDDSNELKAGVANKNIPLKLQLQKKILSAAAAQIQIEAVEKLLAQARAVKKDLETVEKVRDNILASKARTRRNILVGACMTNAVDTGKFSQDTMMQLLNEFFDASKSKADREFLKLPPLVLVSSKVTPLTEKPLRRGEPVSDIEQIEPFHRING